MATEFDHARAWRELAQPTWLSLDETDRMRLYVWTVEHADELKQDRDCDVQPPTEFRQLTTNLSTEYLAVLSRAAYFMGHWRPGNDVLLKYPGLPDKLFKAGENYPLSAMTQAKNYVKLLDEYPVGVPGEPEFVSVDHGIGDSKGATWKLSHMLDVILRERLGVAGDVKNGFQIIEGMLRFCKSTTNSWEWEEVAFANPESLGRCKAVVAMFNGYEDRITEMLQATNEADPLAKKWLDKTLCYSHKNGTSYDTADLLLDSQRLPQQSLKFVSCGGVNFRPHPFVIGPRHLSSGSTYLDPFSAPCAMQGCGLPYERHTHDTAMFVELIAPYDEKAVASVLTQVKALAETNKVTIDGFAFLPSKFSLPRSQE